MAVGEPWQWGYNSYYSAQTITSNTTYPTYPITGRIILDEAPVAPAPRSEVERLLDDVESVCALAR